MSTATSTSLNACDHKLEIGCALSALPVCCGCADKRPLAAAYPIYIDGEGMKTQGKRWARYCWKCRDFWTLTNTLDSLSIPQPFAPESTMDRNSNQELPARPLNPQARSFASRQPGTSQNENPFMPPADHRRRSNRHSEAHSTPTHVPIARRANANYSVLDPQPHPPGPPLPERAREQIFPLGTRADVEQEDYQSPVGGMFSRAWERYRVAEEVRQEAAVTHGVPAHAIRTFDNQGFNVNPAEQFLDHNSNDNYVPVGEPLYEGTGVQLGYSTTFMPAAPGQTNRLPSQNYHHNQHGRIVFDHGHNPIDSQANRPQPVRAEDLVVNMACKICFEQKMDTLIEPCMHLAMCRWCSDAWMANARELRGQDPAMRQPWKCPVCRRAIQQIRKVYF